ncbi:MAG TPA: nitroreductase family deazaflavin-dependent oxidoreductase [Anaerolineales bacterium]|nr:nitroreductase family deazaflavin-dependent oxidoreductase [Anaerolineales bacterium]
MNDSTRMPSLPASLAGEDFCYLTTTGRVTGKPHEIEIWFGLRDHSIYLMSGGGESADWVKNLRKEPNVSVRIASQHFRGMARLVSDEQEEMAARNIVADKYNEREADGSLDEWARTALVVAIDLISMAL